MDWDEKEPVFVGVDKIDLEAEDGSSPVAGSVLYGPSITGGEAFFVPSHIDPTQCDGKWHTQFECLYSPFLWRLAPAVVHWSCFLCGCCLKTVASLADDRACGEDEQCQPSTHIHTHVYSCVGLSA